MALPNVRRRRGLLDFGRPGRKLLLPRRDQARESRVALHPLLGRGALGAGQHAKRVFGGEQLVLGRSRYGRGVAHCSRQLLSLIMARLIQLFIGAERDAHARRQLLVGIAVEKCAAESGVFVDCQPFQAAVQSGVVLRDFQRAVGACGAVGELGRLLDRLHPPALTASRAADRWRDFSRSR